MQRALPRVRVAVAGLALAGIGCINPTEFRTLEREVAALKGVESAAGGEIGEADGRLAELGAQMLELEQTVSHLRGEVEEARHVADEALARASSQPEPEPERDPTPAALEVGEYEEAFRLYRATDYKAAIDRFQGFLQNYPSSDYADNALFWIGECWFKLEDYEQAVLTFDDVSKKYAKGNKVPDAQYRQAVALIEIGRRSQDEETYNAAAREIFEKIVTEYPNSERVPEARRQLEKLGS